MVHYIYYHGDLDGETSAAIIVNQVLTGDHDAEIDCIECQYDYTYDFSCINKEDRVYIVDFSFDVAKFSEIEAQTNNITWIDHHKSTIDKYKDYPNIDNIAGIRFSGIAGCELTWLYYNTDFKNNDLFELRENIPEPIRLIGDYDVWDHKFPESFAFFYGLSIVNTEPDTVFMENLVMDHVSTDFFIKKGNVILKYLDNQSVSNLKKGIEIELNGIKGFALNSYALGSRQFLNKMDDYDFVCRFNFNGKTNSWNYSLYSSKDYVDCSEIAASLGGGGHKGAAGFVTKAPPSFL